ncbi:DUF6886 family protein [Paenibacillus lautus]|uniref:Uncharacterized protein n=1 Tax=Paenibacillus lautus TaxID=1401 RepID=A0A385THU7_PAELA|nr:DUF6886 family protein [Paenibacillus lautus]AYB43223.1 hypothetical protein D5F53_07965 [Paenibacillus lautus]MBY0162625.1 hypothetical protein [Cytobacillus firmus]
MLYHFSEEPDIPIFEPRILYNQNNEPAKVWVIDAHHAPHYYFPRECPRVCVEAVESTTKADVETFFGMSCARRMIAIEAAWYERVRTGCVYRYSFDPTDFELFDANAGYYIATKTVVPVRIERMDDLVASILQEGIELRITPSLMPLKERIPASTVNFSMIRMRNARTEE